MIKLILIALFFISTTTSSPAHHTPTIALFTKENHEGTSLTIHVNRCVSLKKYSFLSHGVRSINTHDSCVNLYQSSDCSGNYLVVKPGTDSHTDLNYLKRYHRNIGSVGLCHEVCHPSTIESLDNNRTHVRAELVSPRLEDDVTKEVKLEKDKCVQVPEELDAQIHTLKTDTPACVEIYELPNCRGSSEMFTFKEANETQSLFLTQYRYSRSISLCGLNCNRNRVSLEEPEVTTEQQETVTQDTTFLVDQDNLQTEKYTESTVQEDTTYLPF